MKLKELNTKEVIKLLQENLTPSQQFEFGWTMTNDQRVNLVLILQIWK